MKPMIGLIWEGFKKGIMKTYKVKLVQVLKFVTFMEIDATSQEAANELGEMQDPILSIGDGDEMDRICTSPEEDSGLVCVHEDELNTNVVPDNSYGIYVESDGSIDYWLIANKLFPTTHIYLDKDKSYRFNIDNGFAYPDKRGIMDRKNFFQSILKN